jgi:hypothetical protein
VALGRINYFQDQIMYRGKRGAADAGGWFSILDIGLRGLRIGAEGAKAVAEALKVNSTLQTIDLDYNGIGDEGAKAAAEAIKVNSTLQTIYLDYNGIGDGGAKAVAEAIKVNSTLQTIYLGGNSIGAEGAKAIAEAIKVNSMLDIVDLGGHGGKNLKSQIAATLREIRSRNEANYRKFICAFTTYQVDSARLRFDKMMLRYVFYPILGVSEKTQENHMKSSFSR